MDLFFWSEAIQVKLYSQLHVWLSKPLYWLCCGVSDLKLIFKNVAPGSHDLPEYPWKIQKYLAWFQNNFKEMFLLHFLPRILKWFHSAEQNSC